MNPETKESLRDALYHRGSYDPNRKLTTDELRARRDLLLKRNNDAQEREKLEAEIELLQATSSNLEPAPAAVEEAREPLASTPHLGEADKEPRQDDLAIELALILDAMGDERITASSVMPKLKSRAGFSDSCITEPIPEGVMWIRGSTGQSEKLTMNALKDRIKRIKKGR